MSVNKAASDWVGTSYRGYAGDITSHVNTIECRVLKDFAV